MTTIVNPITGKGKVTCLHYYERCLHKKWYDLFIGIFVFELTIYLYKVERKEDKKTLINFGELDPLNMTKAINRFKRLII